MGSRSGVEVDWFRLDERGGEFDFGLDCLVVVVIRVVSWWGDGLVG